MTGCKKVNAVESTFLLPSRAVHYGKEEIVAGVFGLSSDGRLCVLAADVNRQDDKIIFFNNNGGWCWFQDERAIIHDNKLLVGSVAHARGTAGFSRSTQF